MSARNPLRSVAVWAAVPVLLWALSGDALAQQRRNSQPSNVSLVGRVVLENGQPPSESVQVELVCSGRVSQQVLTDPRGNFVIDLGDTNQQDWIDPGMGGSARGRVEDSVRVGSPTGRVALDEVPSVGLGRSSLSGCEVRASPRPGFSSNIIGLSNRGVFDNPEIGTIVLQRLGDATVTTVSLSTLKAPKGALKAYEKANEELGKADPNAGKAAKELEKALKEYPEFSAAWDLLGAVQMSQGKRDEGRKSFLKAVEYEPGFLHPYLALSQAAIQESDWDEARTWSAKSLELSPNEPSALYWHGLANYYLRDLDVCAASLSRLYEMGHESAYPFGLLALGVVHAGQGKIPLAARELRLYLRLMPEGQVPATQREELERQLSAWQSEGLIPEAPAEIQQVP